MIQFRGGFISRQTGDGYEKPETECQESQESRKSGGCTRRWKVENYRFPMWFMNRGSYSFWFRANSRLKCVGRRFRCES